MNVVYIVKTLHAFSLVWVKNNEDSCYSRPIWTVSRLYNADVHAYCILRKAIRMIPIWTIGAFSHARWRLSWPCPTSNGYIKIYSCNNPRFVLISFMVLSTSLSFIHGLTSAHNPISDVQRARVWTAIKAFIWAFSPIASESYSCASKRQLCMLNTMCLVGGGLPAPE